MDLEFNNMELENINSIAQIVLVAHTLILYPIAKFLLAIDKRITKLEINKELKCDLKCTK